MSQIIFKVSSQDTSFLDFYEPLAHNLQGVGTVYTPHPVIPPNARMATPAPTNILVALNSADAFKVVHQTMRTYLKGRAQRTLTLERGEEQMIITGDHMPEVDLLRNKLKID